MNLTTVAALTAILIPGQVAPPAGGAKGQAIDKGQIGGRRTIQLAPNAQLQPTNFSVKFNLYTMSYQKAEDENGKDEPYLFTCGFRLQIAHDLRGFFVGAGGIQTFPVGTLDHRNLGYSSEGWARSGKRYALSGQEFNTSLPAEGGLQVTGIVTMMMEEDGFNAEQMRRLREDFPVRLRKHLEGYQFESVKQPQSYIDETIKRLGRWIYDFQASHYITFFTTYGSGDPDDVGGTQTAFLVNFGNLPPKNSSRTGLQLTTGGWFSAEPLNFVELRRDGMKSFLLSYPAGDVNRAPVKARWKGQAIVGGTAARDR